MEKQRICKICNRRFPNGKAMGGHMRSHLAKLPIPPKPLLKTTSKSSESTPPTQSPSSSSSLNLVIPRKNPKPFYRSLNRELSQDYAVHDKESETESQPNNNLTRRRSKRRRKEVVKVGAEQVSSIMSESTLSEEDVALCLIMLSKDKWAEKPLTKGEAADELDDEEEEVPAEEEEEDDDDDDDDDDEDDEEEPLCRSRTRTSRDQSNNFKCETCKKAFRSYQALGGHRASHKKIIIKAQIFEDEFSKDCNPGSGTINYVIEHKTFACPYCYKVFDSGQALGGHKKVHFSNFSNTRNNINAATKFNDNLVIDLNLPAPQEEEELSNVSDYY